MRDETSQPEAAGSELVAVGERIGRYVVRGELGAGGMGRVLEAHDPRLDRRVAIKILKRARAGTRPMQARLLREGQALARLSHPNVVEVFEAGSHAGDIFVAMELVRGPTLRAWRAESDRSWREVVAMYLAAGRGLAAAHALGLVHRDFKPDNVLVGPQGTPKVVDFGLARAPGDADSDSRGSGGRRASSGHGLLDTVMTELGTVMGTPVYIAPEVWRGRPFDARADQFAFGVSLYEALFGHRPYTVAQLREMKPRGSRGPAPPKGVAVPRAVVDVVRRAMAPDPDRRWPSMDALLGALQSATRRRRARWGWAAAGVLGVAAFWAMGTEAPACPSADDLATRLWPGPRRAEVVAALGAQSRAVTGLDDLVARWAAARHEVCVDPPPDPKTADLRAACLEERHAELRALIEGIDRPGVDASTVVAGAPSPDTCASIDTLARRPEPPPDQRAAVAAMRREIAALSREHEVAAPGLVARSVDVLRRAQALGFEPLTAEARELHAGVLQASGDGAAATAALTAAYLEAERSGYDALAFRAATLLVMWHAGGQRTDEAAVWLRHAEGLMARRGEPDIRMQRRLHRARADLFAQTDRHEEAERELAAVLESLGDTDEDRVAVADVYARLARTRRHAGDYAGAIDHYERALQLKIEAFGPDDPSVAREKVNLAGAVYARGDIDEALALTREGDAIMVAARGEDYPDRANVFSTQGSILSAAGRNAEALVAFERAAALAARTLGDKHLTTVTMRANLGVALQNEGELTRARKMLARALDDLIEIVGPEHAYVGQQRVAYGDVLLELGEIAAARDMLEQGLRITERTKGPRSFEASLAAFFLGEARLLEGDPEAAIEQLQRAADGFEATVGTRSVRYGVTLARLATAQVDAGHTADAEATLTVVDALPPDAILPKWAVMATFDRARLRRLAGDEAEAQRLARDAKSRLAELPDAPPAAAGRVDEFLAR